MRIKKHTVLLILAVLGLGSALFSLSSCEDKSYAQREKEWAVDYAKQQVKLDSMEFENWKFVNGIK